MDIGAAVGSTQGIDSAELIEVAEFRTRGRFSNRERVTIEYAEEMCKTPVAVPDGLFSRLRGLFTEAQIVEITAVVAFENFRARFNRALAIESDGLYRPA